MVIANDLDCTAAIFVCIAMQEKKQKSNTQITARGVTDRLSTPVELLIWTFLDAKSHVNGGASCARWRAVSLSPQSWPMDPVIDQDFHLNPSTRQMLLSTSELRN
jgi:hypothetical protein